MMKPFAIAGLTALLFASTSGIAAAEQSATVPKTEALEARVGGTVSSSQQSKQYPVTEMRAGMRGLYGKFFSGTLTLGENSVSYAGKEPKFNFNIPYSQISTDVKVLVLPANESWSYAKPYVWFNTGNKKHIFKSETPEITIDLAVELMDRIGQEHYIFLQAYEDKIVEMPFTETVDIPLRCTEDNATWKLTTWKLTTDRVIFPGSTTPVPYDQVSPYFSAPNYVPDYDRGHVPWNQSTVSSPYGNCNIHDVDFEAYFHLAYRKARALLEAQGGR